MRPRSVDHTRENVMAQARKAFVCVTVASLFILALSGCVKHDQGNAEDAGGTKNSIPIGWEQRQAKEQARHKIPFALDR